MYAGWILNHIFSLRFFPMLEAEPGFWYVLGKCVTNTVLSFKSAFTSRPVSSQVLGYGFWSSWWAVPVLRSCWWWWLSGGVVARFFHPCEVTLCLSVTGSMGYCVCPWMGRCWQAESNELGIKKQALLCAWGPKPVLLLLELAAFGTLGSRTALSLELDLSQQVCDVVGFRSGNSLSRWVKLPSGQSGTLWHVSFSCSHRP